MREPDSLQRKEGILLLVQRIAELPHVQKKVLAMYYFENLPLADIAVCFGLTEGEVDQFRAETVRLLHTNLFRDLEQH